ncbi:MAG: CoA pyrophosphatase [Actinomycetota bacterium]|nr:CoA pyrophosphatase [Actinomycetota bacterium]
MSGDFNRALERALAQHPPHHPEPGGARAAAVLIPIVAEPEPTLLFTVRTETLPSHKGQISFPGGSIDPSDPTSEAAALREAEEELGLGPSAVRILGELDTVLTHVSGYIVSPFVGWIDKHPSLAPNPTEVARVLLVPLAQLTDQIRAEPGFSHGGRTYPTEAWIWRGSVIWGVTAHLLRLFFEVLAEAGLAEAPAAPSVPWPLSS